jgi:GntR family transcriptional regulator, carbon starvation induced regulator
VQAARHKLKVLGRAYQDGAAPEVQAWHMQHLTLHEDLASGCPNAWWLRLRQQLYIQSERYRRLAKPMEAGDRDIPGEHDAIVDAALARDRVAAQRALTDHLQRTADVILNAPLRFGDLAHGQGQDLTG